MRALDVACGLGRNASFLAGRGYAVDGWDVSDVAIHQAQVRDPEISWACMDLLKDPLPAGSWGLICVIRFVALDLLRTLCKRLTPGGVLVVEQHLQWPYPIAGPGSDRFRVAPGQLVNIVSEMGLEILHARDGLLQDPDAVTMAISQVIAQRKSDERDSE